MEPRYVVAGVEYKTDYGQIRSEHRSLDAAKRAARSWLRGRYLGQSQAWVTDGDEIVPVYSCLLDSDGKIREVQRGD